MATASKKVRTAKSPSRVVRSGAGVTSLPFAVYQDNGGEYHWEITDDTGRGIAHSESFSSQDDAEHAARYLCEGAGAPRPASATVK